MMTFALVLSISFAGLPETKPEQVGFDPNRLALVDQTVGRAIFDGKAARRRGGPGGEAREDRPCPELRPAHRRDDEPGDAEVDDLRPGLAHEADRDGHARHAGGRTRPAPARRPDPQAHAGVRQPRQGVDHRRTVAQAPIGPDGRQSDRRLQGRRGAGVAENRRTRPRGEAGGEVPLQRRGLPGPRAPGRAGVADAFAVLDGPAGDLPAAGDEGHGVHAGRWPAGPRFGTLPAPVRADGEGEGRLAARRRPRPEGEGAGRGRRECGTLRHGRRPRGLRADAPGRRQGARRISDSVALERPEDDRPGRLAAGSASRPGLGHRHPVQLAPGPAFRPEELRPYGVHRHEPLDRPGDRDDRDPPDQPPPSRRQAPVADRPPRRGRHDRRLGNRRHADPRRQTRGQTEAGGIRRRHPSRRLRDRRPLEASIRGIEREARRPRLESHRQGRRTAGRRSTSSSTPRTSSSSPSSARSTG